MQTHTRAHIHIHTRAQAHAHVHSLILCCLPPLPPIQGNTAQKDNEHHAHKGAPRGTSPPCHCRGQRHEAALSKAPPRPVCRCARKRYKALFPHGGHRPRPSARDPCSAAPPPAAGRTCSSRHSSANQRHHNHQCGGAQQQQWLCSRLTGESSIACADGASPTRHTNTGSQADAVPFNVQASSRATS